MPIHDWTAVDAGIFHHFHHDWMSEISRHLNRRLRGTEYYAQAEQIAGDPQGIHAAVWGDDESDTFRYNASRPLTCASYIGGLGAEAFVEPAAIGKPLPSIPLFLTPEEYVPVGLEETYQRAFDAVPEVWQEALAPTLRKGKRRRKG